MRARWNNLLAATDLRIGATTLDQLAASASGQKMMLGGDAVWPADQAYDPNDGSAFQAIMRALASQYDGGGYADMTAMPAGYIGGIPGDWARFDDGGNYPDASLQTPFVAWQHANNGFTTVPVGDPAAVTAGVPDIVTAVDADSLFGTWPWLVGGENAPGAIHSGRWNSAYYPPMTLQPGRGTDSLLAGCFRFNGPYVGLGSKFSSGMMNAIIGYGENKHRNHQFGVYSNRDKGASRGPFGWQILVCGSQGWTDVTSHNNSFKLNDVTQQDVDNGAALDVDRGDIVVFALNATQFSWKKIGQTTWSDNDITNPDTTSAQSWEPGSGPNYALKMSTGHEDTERYTGSYDPAWALLLPNGGDQIDLVKDIWDAYGV